MHIVFFEKPGCAGNSQQKELLKSAGHDLETHDLLTYPFTKNELLSFFGDKAVTDWFNRSAPRIKSGAVRPETYSPDIALELLLNEPILIKRPLLKIAGQRCAGFDVQFIESVAGTLPKSDLLTELQRDALANCPGEQRGKRCLEASPNSLGMPGREGAPTRGLCQPEHV